jgi:hypothetical protein
MPAFFSSKKMTQTPSSTTIYNLISNPHVLSRCNDWWVGWVADVSDGTWVACQMASCFFPGLTMGGVGACWAGFISNLIHR